MDEKGARPVDEMSFGEALGELEGIVGSLECGDLDLDASLERYERGVALLRGLRTRLADAEQRVTMLLGELGSDADSTEPAVEE